MCTAVITRLTCIANGRVCAWVFFVKIETEIVTKTHKKLIIATRTTPTSKECTVRECVCVCESVLLLCNKVIKAISIIIGERISKIKEKVPRSTSRRRFRVCFVVVFY